MRMSPHCGGLLKLLTGFLSIALIFGFTAKRAFAQENGLAQTGGEPTAPVEAGITCVPECRVGFLCHEGECKSLCNPPCPDGETCSQDKTCIPRSIEEGAATTESEKRRNTDASAILEYNLARYEQFRKSRNVGIGLMVGAVVGIGVAGGLVATGIIVDSDDRNGKPLIIAGSLLPVVAAVVLITGIVKTVSGRKGMKKAKFNYYDPQQPWKSSLELRRTVALTSKGRNAEGGVVSFGFNY